MNYKIESSFMNDENLDILIWAEKMLHKFINSKDRKLGLNKCSKEEKEIVKILCKSFFLNYHDTKEKSLIEKTEDSRSPFLTLHDYLSTVKINKHFKKIDHLFYTNIDEFPKKFKHYKREVVENEIFMEQKLTNKELSEINEKTSQQQEMGNIEDEFVWKKISQQKFEPLSAEEEEEQQEEPHKETKQRVPNLELSNGQNELQESSQEEEISQGNEISEEIAEDIDENAHAIKNWDLPKFKWNKKYREDISRLPTTRHILFVVLDQKDEEELLSLVKEQGKGVTIKHVQNLGCFLLCESENIASDWFHYLHDSWIVYSLSNIPKELKIDALRSEFCFMEGVRPIKTTVVAERLIKRHLGFI